jgi:CrcB protein
LIVYLRECLLVGAGGFLGVCLCFVVSGVVQRMDSLVRFPYGTLGVNLLDCLAIGFLGGLGESRQIFGPGARFFVFIGIFGGFTTFSTFGFKSFALLREGENLKALLNVTASVVLGLGAVWVGYAVTMR